MVTKIHTLLVYTALQNIISEAHPAPSYPIPGSILPWSQYFDWIRSPTPLNVYPKIFTKLGRPKRGATSHSTSWGKRSDGGYPEQIIDKRTSSLGIRKVFQNLKRQPVHGMNMKVGLKRNVQYPDQTLQDVHQEDSGPIPMYDDDNISGPDKRLWLPELDYPDQDEDDIDDDYDTDDEVTKKPLAFEYTPTRYYAMWGDLYKSPYYTVTRKGRKLAELAMKYYMEQDPIIFNRQITKRRMGLIQTSSILPKENEKCFYLDKISRHVCFYLMSKVTSKFKKSCEKGCFNVGTKRQAGTMTGDMSALAPSLSEGNGKKYRKIFVRI